MGDYYRLELNIPGQAQAIYHFSSLTVMDRSFDITWHKVKDQRPHLSLPRSENGSTIWDVLSPTKEVIGKVTQCGPDGLINEPRHL